jgi:predicted phosphoadenosine phosphosulfate sulfurtransferase
VNVWDATQQRLAAVFAEFDNIYVSFSGGKDSGVLLHLCLDWLRRHEPGRKLGVFHIDYEAQYQATTDYVSETLAANAGALDVWHCCLPIAAQCATSMHQDRWIPWNPEQRDIWVRELPDRPGVVTEEACPFDFFRHGIWDYDLQAEFGPWLHRHAGARRTACLVGIRTQESLNRWRALHSGAGPARWRQETSPGVWNVYPIFDWQSRDVWIANARNGWPYNRLYDLFHKAGLSIDQMRVASPFNDCAKTSLALYRVIDPHNWGKLLGRVDGVNFTGIYGGTTAMGWRSIKLPPGHTWKSYLEFLLATLPAETRKGYQERLAISLRFWKEKGGCLSAETVAALRGMGITVDDSGTTNRKTTKRPVKMDYVDDIDHPDFQFIPSYKRMCICVLKNDHFCKYMGFQPGKAEVERRRAAERKYRDCLSGLNGNHTEGDRED